MTQQLAQQQQQLLANLGHIGVLDAAGQLNPAYGRLGPQGPTIDWGAVCAALVSLDPMVVHKEHFQLYVAILRGLYPPPTPKSTKRPRSKVMERARLVFSPFQIKVMVDLARELVAEALAQVEERPSKRPRVNQEDTFNFDLGTTGPDEDFLTPETL